MPPGPQQYTCEESIFMPSGRALALPVVSAQTLPPASVPHPSRRRPGCAGGGVVTKTRP